MARLDVQATLPCGPERVKRLLVDHEFLTEFVSRQQPISSQVHGDTDAGSATATWTSVVSTDVPGLFKKLVGDSVLFELRIDTSNGRLEIIASGKQSGSFVASMALTA